MDALDETESLLERLRKLGAEPWFAHGNVAMLADQSVDHIRALVSERDALAAALREIAEGDFATWGCQKIAEEALRWPLP